MKFTLPAAAMLAVVSTSAGAASLSVQETFALFNGVTEGNFNSSQEVEGRLYVGGDLTGSSIQIGFKGVAASDLDEGIVVGNSTVGNLNLQNGSDVTVGGDVAGNIGLNGGTQGNQTARIGGTHTSGAANLGTVLENQATDDPNFADRFPEIDFSIYVDESDYLSELSGIAMDTSDFNNKKIIGSPDSDGLSVHTATMNDLMGGGLTIDANGASTVLINVSGTVGTFSMNLLGASSTFAENVVWNFYEATDVTINTAVIGSILAPLANLSGFGGSTEGSVIAKTIDLQNGELHSRIFEGTLPTASTAGPGVEVPLPAALPLLGGGLGLMAMVGRRRRKA